jgi:hypothetical protein
MTNIKTEIYIGIDAVRRLGIERIFNIVCDYLGVDGEDVKGKTRKGNIAEARHVFCFLAYHSIANHTLKEVGEFIDRDHSTVLHSKNRIQDFLEFDKKTIKMIADLRNKLGKFSSDDISNTKITASHVGYYNTYKRKKDLQEWAQKNDIVSKLVIN